MSLGDLHEVLPDDEIAELLDAAAKPAQRCIRLRPDRIGIEPLPMAVEAVPWFPRGRLLVDSSLRPSQSLQFAAADYYIQDAGSLLALALLDVQPHEAICDLCASPGGKASGIVESLGEHGFLIANEVIASRASILRYALSRTGSPRYAVAQQEPEVIADRFSGLFDAVLVDAPCSGQTMVGRGKRDSNAFDTKQIEHSAKRQQRILLEAVKLLKPGGRLVYSTCTFSVEENEDQIRFLHQHFPDSWEPIQSSQLAKWASPIEEGCYRLWPHRDATSGAFAAGVVLKKELDFRFEPSTFRKPRRQHAVDVSRRRKPFDVKLETVLSSLGEVSSLNTKHSASGFISAIASDAPSEIVKRLVDQERIVLATERQNIIKPEFALAMLASHWFQPIDRIDIREKSATQFMLGQAMSIESFTKNHVSQGDIGQISPLNDGWKVVTWHNKPLGWAKYAGNRFNNHLPKHAILPIPPIDSITSPSPMFCE